MTATIGEISDPPNLAAAPVGRTGRPLVTSTLTRMPAAREDANEVLRPPTASIRGACRHQAWSFSFSFPTRSS
jgi:hypothetical protein